MSMGTMAGAGKKRRRPMSEINMTPLVDVMLVLLVIFMITAPHLDKESIDVDLPQAKGNSSAGKIGTPLTVSMDANGCVYFAGKKLEPGEVKTELPKLLQGHEKEVATVKSARTLPIDSVMKVVSTISAAGLKVTIAVDAGK